MIVAAAPTARKKEPTGRERGEKLRVETAPETMPAHA